MEFLSALPGTVAQGLIWGIMAIGVYITYKVLDIADLTVDGSICTGAAVCTMLIINGQPVWLAMILATLAGGNDHRFSSYFSRHSRHTFRHTDSAYPLVGKSEDNGQSKSIPLRTKL